MCAVGILPPLPPPTGGSVRPTASPARPWPKAARLRANAERGDSRAYSTAFPGGQGGSAGTAAPRRPHTPLKDRKEEKFGFGGSPSPNPVRVAASGRRREPSDSASPRGAARSRHPVSRLSELPGSQNFSPPERGPSNPRAPCLRQKREGAHLGEAHPGGSRPQARVRDRSGSQRGWGRPERGLQAMPSERAALRECGAAGPGRRRRRSCCLQCRLAED